MGFALLANRRAQLPESEMRFWDLDLAEELKKNIYNIKETVIAIIIGPLGTTIKGFI